MSTWGFDSSFSFVPLPVPDQISITKIQFSKYFGSFQKYKTRGDEWEGVAVLNRDVA